MDCTIPEEITLYLAELDAFIEREIKPLERGERQHPLLRPPPRMGAHRFRQWRPAAPGMGGAAGRDAPARRRGRAFALRAARGNTAARTAPISRWRSSASTSPPRASGLHNDLQNENSIVGNLPTVLMFRDFGTEAQKRAVHPRHPRRRDQRRLRPDRARATARTPPGWRPARCRDGDGWRINGAKMWNTGMHVATHDFVFARTSGKDGDAKGITCFLVPAEQRDSRSRSISGPSTCRPTIRGSR